jgi:hypothetical protein
MRPESTRASSSSMLGFPIQYPPFYFNKYEQSFLYLAQVAIVFEKPPSTFSSAII